MVSNARLQYTVYFLYTANDACGRETPRHEAVDRWLTGAWVDFFVTRWDDKVQPVASSRCVGWSTACTRSTFKRRKNFAP